MTWKKPIILIAALLPASLWFQAAQPPGGGPERGRFERRTRPAVRVNADPTDPAAGSKVVRRRFQ